MTPVLDVLLKVTLVLGAGFALTWFARHGSAALRHWLLAMTTLAAASMPLAVWLAPSWALPSFAPTRSVGALRPGEPVGVPATATVTLSTTAARPRSAPSPLSIGAAQSGVSVGALGGVWALGSAAGVFGLALGLIRLVRLTSRGRPVHDQRWQAALGRTCSAAGVRRRVRLLSGDHPALVLTWGVFRPLILVPADARDWPDEQIDMVLAHEIAHIQRGDWPIQCAVEIVRALYWFHPFAWLAARRIRQESEHACDDVVLGSGAARAAYAATLLDLARAVRSRPHAGSAALAMARPAHLERRITAMLNTHLDRSPLSRWTRAATLCAAIGMAVPVAGLQAQATGRLTGVVSAKNGGPLASIDITLTTEGQAARTLTSDASGRFDAKDLAPAAYRIEIRTPGFKPFEDTVTVAAGQTATRNLVLSLGTIRETIVVRGGESERPLKERTREAPRGAAPQPARGSIDPPRKMKDVRPVYPAALSASGIGGVVSVEGVIGTDGTMKDLKVVSTPHADLTKAALDAIREWRFTPTRLQGKEVDTEVTVTVEFQPGAEA